MREFTMTLEKAPVHIYMTETRDDLEAFQAWSMEHQREPVAIDVEATGLDVFSPDFRLLSVQFGIADEAWVIPWSDDPVVHDYVRQGVRRSHRPVYHNSTYDLLALLPRIGFDPESYRHDRLEDTRILAHLLDPRTKAEGGSGHSLKELAAIWVDSAAPDGQTALKERFRELGGNQSTGWSLVAPTDPVLVRYAGLDTILTRRVFDVLDVLVTQAGFDNLRKFEYELAALLRQMQARGIKLDVEYTENLRESLLVQQLDAKSTAARYGVSSINSTAQVADALTGMGEELRERTSGGKPKVDKAVLLPLADLDRNWQRIGARTPNPLAEAVLYGKRAGKWSESYVQAFLDLKDADDRIHPWINGLQARTARMSVSRPPLQQLPANDSTIRRAFVADDRHTMLAVDYSQIEMRVLAAIANDETMINAIKTGVDLHDFTAERLFGSDFTDKQRKIAKGVGFGKVYGGGVATLTRQTGADADSVKRAIAAYDDTFPGVKRLSNALIRSAEFGRKEVRTPSGRVLPLDRDRLYAATNYIVQSTARDVMAQAMLDMAKAGLDRFMLLPIHDEVLAQAPVRDAEDVLREMKKVMEERPFMGVPLVADGEIVGSNWGEAYV